MSDPSKELTGGQVTPAFPPRSKARRWAALVAIPALAVYVAMSYANRYIYVEKATAAAHAERISRSPKIDFGSLMSGEPPDPGEVARREADRERARRIADYFGALRAKYEFASMFPFLPLPPDPPQPL